MASGHSVCGWMLAPMKKSWVLYWKRMKQEKSMYVPMEYEKHVPSNGISPTSLFFLLTVARLLYAWAEELPAHFAAWRGGTHQADCAAVCPGPHQDEGGPGGLHSRLMRVRSGELNMHLLAGQSPTRTWPVRAASKDPGEPDPERLLSKRESETGARHWERASANVRVKWCERWEVPYTRRVWCAWENERSRDWQRRLWSYPVTSVVTVELSCVPQLCHFNFKAKLWLYFAQN